MVHSMYLFCIFLIAGILECTARNVEEDIAQLFHRLGALERQVERLEAENEALRDENRRILNTGNESSNNFEANKPISNANISHGHSDYISKHHEYADPKFIGKAKKTVKPGYTNRKRLLSANPTPVSTQPVAFRAYTTKSISSLGAHQIVEYDGVPLNIGHAYDSLHGHLIAPTKGLYLLSFSAFAVGGKRVVLDIVQNGQQVDVLDTGLNTGYSSQTKVFPIILEVGDMVWARTRQGAEGQYVWGGTNVLHNMFSAVLLYKL